MTERKHPNRYANAAGPPRAARNLDRWTQGPADRALDDEIEAREKAAAKRRKAVPDVHEVADKVLAGLPAKNVKAVPRRLRNEVLESLASRGVKDPTREQQLAEAKRILTGTKAADDLETSLALILAAMLSWEPLGGWKAHRPKTRGDGFHSIGHLLSAAFAGAEIGGGAIGLEVAQNRARTRSNGKEIYVSASHTSSGNVRNLSAVDRQIEAQSIVMRSGMDLAQLPLLFERHVLKRYDGREALLDELRQREARKRKNVVTFTNADDPTDTLRGTVPVLLPSRPPKKATESELSAWRLACGIALWGEAENQEQHNRKHDGAMLRAVRDAEDALRAAIGKEKPKRGSVQKSREVTHG